MYFHLNVQISPLLQIIKAPSFAWILITICESENKILLQIKCPPTGRPHDKENS